MEKIAKELPSEPVKLGSALYIERPPVEAKVCQEITKEGCIIRIKSPQKMGKTSLVLRLIEQAIKLNYFTVYIDFLQADEEIFSSNDKFLRWFCANISKQLQLESMINDYWDAEIGSKVNCTFYLGHYILPKIKTPLVLVINELSRIFEYSTVASDFLALLRSWYESARYDSIWRQLRLVLVYSTEVYIRLNINQSPFNVGLSVELPEFTVEQIQELALRHHLDWFGQAGKRYAFELKSLLGGHPYLVRVFLDFLVNNHDIKFEKVLEDAHTMTGIYSHHLRSLLTAVIKHPELVSALKELIYNTKVTFNPIIAYKLESLGLVKLDEFHCTFACELYRKYFTAQNLDQLSVWQFMKKLQQENEDLKKTTNTDEITLLSNRRYFDTALNLLWLMLLDEEAPMSMILLDIDHLKIYNHSYGHKAGDDCLKKVGNVIKKVVSNFSQRGLYQIKVARYSGGEFAILAPGRTVDTTLDIAESIRKQVKDLGIQQTQRVFGLAASVVTVSLGVVCTIPSEDKSPSILMEIARQALHESKNNGRNCTSVRLIN
ncbi:MAG: AAA-like domain-containing protein [Calothrix sp. C42_A2020_038]|nr:AAA-like domain-containing protein [Calothrix sp. C42_A2020_038]